MCYIVFLCFRVQREDRTRGGFEGYDARRAGEEEKAYDEKEE